MGGLEDPRQLRLSTGVSICEISQGWQSQSNWASYMMTWGSKIMHKRWEVEAASVLRPELGNWYDGTFPVFYKVTELGI